jgi:type IV pilus assembly protein PilO
VDLNQINELDFQTIGEWPKVAKAILILILCAGVAGAWYYFDTKEQLTRLEKADLSEQRLRKDFERKQQKAVNLDAYRRQLAEMQASFGAMLRQLPDKTEVPALLVDVSQTGLGAGLEFERFRPSAEVKRGFYAELPIHVRVVGTYPEFGDFISGLAALPRIVTIHNVHISGAKSGRGPLSLEATIKTYRYLEETPQEKRGRAK